MSDREYWEDCVGEALEVADVKATEGQIKIVADWVKSGHDNYSQHGGR